MSAFLALRVNSLPPQQLGRFQDKADIQPAGRLGLRELVIVDAAMRTAGADRV